jgi:ferritin-like metal-binding protein YciE
MELNSLTDVLVDELGDLYSAELQLVAALPRLAAATHSYELRDTLEAHVEETRAHVDRLQEIFDEMGIRFAPTKISKPMEGLIAEGDEIASSDGDPVALDAALIGAAQRVEQYEIASYGTARALSNELGLGKTSSLLDRTLAEEEKANKALGKLAAGGMMSSGINRLAAERSSSLQTEAEVEPPVAVGEDSAATT